MDVSNQQGVWDAADPMAGDDLLFCMDNDTLQDLVLTIPEAATTAEAAPLEDKQRGNKRPRAEPPNDLAAFMQRFQDDDGDGSNPCSSSEGREETAQQGNASSDPGQSKTAPKTKPLGPQAAQKKACREKARREKLNEGFVELAKLIDPNNTKSDKTSIVVDAIRALTHLRAENNQLRQLNKFLQEKVTDFEHQRAQAMLQAGPQYFMPAAYGVAPAGMQPVAMAPMAAPMAAPMVASTSDAAKGPEWMMAAPIAGQASTSSLPPAPASWLPPSTLDCSQDHKLRPPAA